MAESIANPGLALLPLYDASGHQSDIAAMTALLQLDATTNRQYGPVITADHIRALTAAGNAYSATTGKLTAPGAATLGFQLLNPANGTKNILIYSLLIVNGAAGVHQIYKTAANVDTITGWTDVAATISNNGASIVASTAIASYTNVNASGTLLGTAREVTAGAANTAIETLSNGECIWLPAGASAIAGVVVYLNATGANVWAVTAEYLEF